MSDHSLARTPGSQRLRDSDLQARARIFWCELHEDPDPLTATAIAMGLSVATVARWKEQGAPDGRDWEQVRIENMRGLDLAQVAAAGNADEVAMHVEIVKAAKSLLGSVVSSLSMAQLYDEPPPEEGVDMRQPVTKLYDFEGNEVPLSGLRPRTAGEAVKMLGQLTIVLDKGYSKVQALGEVMGRSEGMKDALLKQFIGVVRDKFGSEMAGEVLEAFIKSDGVQAIGQSTISEEQA